MRKDIVYNEWGCEHYGRVNWMKGAINYSDKIVTVSPKHEKCPPAVAISKPIVANIFRVFISIVRRYNTPLKIRFFLFSSVAKKRTLKYWLTVCGRN